MTSLDLRPSKIRHFPSLQTVGPQKLAHTSTVIIVLILNSEAGQSKDIYEIKGHYFIFFSLT